MGSNEYTFRNFVGSFIETVFSVDNKLLRSLLALLRPGLLTADYLRGKRVPYIRPLQLFFFVNVVYFFVQPMSGSNTFNNQLDSQYKRQLYSEEIVKPTVDAYLRNKGLTLEQYAADYNALSSQLARTLIFLMVPVWAGIMWLVTLGLKRTYPTQFIFALHVMSFLLLYYYSGFAVLHYHAAVWLYKSGLDGWAAAIYSEAKLSYTFLAILGVYTAMSLRRLLGISILSAGLRAFAACLFFFEVVALYRLILFFITFGLAA